MTHGLFSILRAGFPDDLTKPAILLPDRTTLSYAQLLADTSRIAHTLVCLGVKPGDRVVVQTEKSAAVILLYLAVQRVGAVYVPLNTAYTKPEVEYFLSDAMPSLFVCTPERLSELAPVAHALGISGVHTLDAAGNGNIVDGSLNIAEDFADSVLKPDDLAAILYTSGTTGKPKGAMMSQRNLGSNAQALVAAWHFSSSDILLHALPIYHTHGLFVAINVALLSGASVILQPSFNVDAVLDALPHATVMMGVPTFYTRLLQSPRLTRDLAPNMRLFISGSAPLQASTHAEFQDRTGHVILERYGMTETGINTSNSYEGERVPGCVGTALPGIEIRIAESGTGAALKDGDVGVIEIRGPNVFKGYWRLPAKTSAELRKDGFFISGDLAFKDKAGRVHIVGREKDLIISGGFNVYPAEVEAAIEQIQGVAQCAVIGVPHPDYGEGTVAVIVPRSRMQVSKDVVRNHLVNELAKYKLPKEIVIVDKLPLNSMGKVQKNLLRDKFATLFR